VQVLPGGADPAAAAGYRRHPPRVGFFTDTSLCIGCKACEVARKEWNGMPEDGLHWAGRSHENSGGLGADTWRHVAFVEQPVRVGAHEPNFQRDAEGLRWLMASDVCRAARRFGAKAWRGRVRRARPGPGRRRGPARSSAGRRPTIREPRTTGTRSSTRRSGRSATSPATCSPAGSRARRR